MTRFLTGVGLANLLLLNEWQTIHTSYRQDSSYLTDVEFPLTLAWSTALAVLLLGTGLALSSLALDRCPWPRAPHHRARLMIALTALAVIAVWLSASQPFVAMPIRLAVAICLLSVATVLLVSVPSQSALRSLASVLSFTAVFLPVCLGSVLWSRAAFSLAPSNRDPAPVASSPSLRPLPGRVVWIVLDEFDSRVDLERRPSTLDLPALDRLRAESLVAEDAHVPGSSTLDALPTLWTGRPVSMSRPTGPSSVLLAVAGESPVELDVSTTIFGEVRAAGGKVGVAGWYHPYCRMFRYVTDACAEASASDALFSFRRVAFAAELGTLAMVPHLLDWHRLWSPEAAFTGGQTASRQALERAFVVRTRVQAYQRIHAKGLAMAADPSLSLVFLHYPVPHLPGFYSRERGAFDLTSHADYLDNVALADRALAEIRASLEQSSLWDKTTVIVHSDHALRPGLWTRLGVWTPELQALTHGEPSSRTPFVVKLATPGEAIRYQHPFNAALAHDLVLDMVRGRVQSTDELIAWLDGNRSRLPLSWSADTTLDR